jgi:hypothetical protein
MNDIQRERYAAEYYRLLGELTQLDAMIAEYPEPQDVKDEQLVYTIEDLARQLDALTAVWSAGIPA